MKFHLQACLCVSTDSFVRVVSQSKLPINTIPSFYAWNPTGIALDGFGIDDGSILSLEFVLTGNILVKRIEVSVSDLKYNKTGEGIFHILKKQGMEMSYNATKYMEDNKLLGKIFIPTISLFDFDPYKFIDPNRRGHKIACVANSIYLGRAQECFTELDARFYYWYPTTEVETSFEGISPRSDLFTEEMADKALINMNKENRKTPIEIPPYIADSDEFKNSKRNLPVYIEGTKLRIIIYNFKFTPPKKIEVDVSCQSNVEFVKQPKRISKWALRPIVNQLQTPSQIKFIEKQLLENLAIEVCYEEIEKGKIKIRSLKLKAISEYEKTLELN